MKHIAICIILILVLAACENPKNKESSSSANMELKNNDWIVLFDGSNTDHWRDIDSGIFPDSGWVVIEDELMNDGSGRGNLLSKDQYSDFIFEWEWRLMDEGGNSGVKYFVKESSDEDGKYALGLEYQMLDDMRHEWMKQGKMKPNDYHTTGALYEFYTPSSDKQMVALGEFNKSKIVSNGNHVEHWLNGKKVVEYERGSDDFLLMKSKSKFKDMPEFGLYDEGYIMLQDHQSRVGFRNIRIKILDTKSPKS